MTTVRDERLGAALRQLDTPEHRPSFHLELERLLAAEAAGRRPVRRPRPRLRWGLRVAFAAALGALAFVALDIVRSGDTPGPVEVQEATAADVKVAVSAAVARAESLSGTYVSRERTPESDQVDSTRGTFVILADGSYHTKDGVREDAYDARRRVSVFYDHGPGYDPYAHRARRLAAGPPDSLGYTDSEFQRELGSVVRALMAVDDDLPVEEIEVRGRRAWRISTPVRQDRLAGEGWSPDHLVIVVDQETGIPLRARWTVDGSLRHDLRMTNVDVNADVSRSELRVRIPAGTELTRSNQGFQRVPLDGVESVVGYAPLVPSWLPEGFELADVTVAEQGNPTGAEAMNPAAPGVVSMAYRRGFDAIFISTRVAVKPTGGAIWSDPLATGEGFVDNPEGVELERGALSGVEANLLIVPLALPHLWALTEELVVTVAGDLSRDELIRVAESLEPGP
jgi:hypothetical protein